MRFSVIVPASSANLGPGFDSMALAVSRYLTVDVEGGAGDNENAQQEELVGGGDMVLESMRYLAWSTGNALPPARIRVSSCVPVARGLGSSAAAIIGGLLAGNHLLDDPFNDDQILRLATEIEEHADNLAAALYGGPVLAVPVGAGHDVVQLALNVDLKAVVLIPDHVSFTRDARSAVPEQLDRSDAVFNASRCALMVHAFASGRPELLKQAMRDRIHQPYRAALYPHLDPVIEAAIDTGAFGASLSGSGPCVLALTDERCAATVAGAMESASVDANVPAVADVLDIERHGARVEAG